MKTKVKKITAAPVIPDSLVAQYFKYKKYVGLYKKVQEQMWQLISMGATHPTIEIVEGTSRYIPWQQLVRELLLEKYENDEQKVKRYFDKLPTRFPLKPTNPQIKPAAPALAKKGK